MRALRCASVLYATLLAGSALAADKPVVLVAGGTGATGSAVVQQLQADGRYQIRVLARDPAKAAARFGDGVEIAAGDVKDTAAVAKAVAGATYVVSAIGAGVAAGADNTPETIDYGGNVKLIDAARAAGVRQFVLVSSMGATHPDHPLNQRFNNILQWKLKGENHLRASGLGYTIVRPGGLRNEPGGEKPLTFAQGDVLGPNQFVPRADVARVAVAALALPAAQRKTFELYVAAEGEPVSPGAEFERLKADP